MNAGGAHLVVEGVSKWFRTPRTKVHALDNVSLEVAIGEVVCLAGPSGCGKSTVLDIVAGLTRPDAGRVIADGRPVDGPGRQRLMVFQEPSLFPWLDVLRNVLFGLKLCPELSSHERREVAHRYLAMAGLEKFERSHVNELSGGMKQRVALAPDPQVLLLDKPFGALDAMTREHLYDDVQRIWAGSGKTILFVTHNIDTPLPRPRNIYDRGAAE